MIDDLYTGMKITTLNQYDRMERNGTAAQSQEMNECTGIEQRVDRIQSCVHSFVLPLIQSNTLFYYLTSNNKNHRIPMLRN